MEKWLRQYFLNTLAVADVWSRQYVKRHMKIVRRFALIVRDVECKSVLNRSRLADYCINPYIGCEHGCKYCYAESYTRRF